MENQQKRTCSERFEVRLKRSEKVELKWAAERLGVSGNDILRMALKRFCEEQRREMLAQAGFPDGKVA